jgi:hypothetical protein
MAKQTLKAGEKVDAKAVCARLPQGMEARLAAELQGDLIDLIDQALAMYPEDAGRAAIRLMQLSGRVPTEAQVAEILTGK